MSQRTIAARYAKALFEVATKESDPAKIEHALAAFVDAMRSHAELGRVLTSPGVPIAARRQIVEKIAAAVRADRPLVKLIVLVAERGRMDMLPTLLDVYRERLLAYRNIVRASVTSATPLPSDTLEAIEQSLGRVTGKQVQLDTAVDPSLIGGLVARIGSTVYDGSVRTQLEKLKQQLVEGAV